jgi:lipoprotein-anchoring transpeptidase ErfK/SrfK
MKRTVQRHKHISGSLKMRFSVRFLTGVLSVAALPVAAMAQQTAPQPVQSDTPPPVATPAPTPVKPAKSAKPAAPKKKASAGDSLKPGQYVWEKRAYKAKDLKIVAVLDIQRIYVFDAGELVAFSTISSGKKGKETPTGVFNILQKNVDHKSNIYDNAPMPYMQRLTWDGIALHAGAIPGYAASHGCIRLPMAFAKALFSVTQMDQQVIVLADLNTPAPKPEPKPEQKPEPEVQPQPELKVDPAVQADESPLPAPDKPSA